MANPMQPNAPQITVQGRTFCVSAVYWNDLPEYIMHVFELVGGVWRPAISPPIAEYLNPGDLAKDVAAKGGKVAYLKWLVAEINKMFAKIFAVAVPPHVTGEPTTDDEAIAWIAFNLSAMKLTLVDGVPVLA